MDRLIRWLDWALEQIGDLTIRLLGRLIRQLGRLFINLFSRVRRRAWHMCFGTLQRGLVSLLILALVMVRYFPETRPFVESILVLGVSILGIVVIVFGPLFKKK